MKSRVEDPRPRCSPAVWADATAWADVGLRDPRRAVLELLTRIGDRELPGARRVALHRETILEQGTFGCTGRVRVALRALVVDVAVAIERQVVTAARRRRDGGRGRGTRDGVEDHGGGPCETADYGTALDQLAAREPTICDPGLLHGPPSSRTPTRGSRLGQVGRSHHSLAPILGDRNVADRGSTLQRHPDRRHCA